MGGVVASEGLRTDVVSVAAVAVPLLRVGRQSFVTGRIWRNGIQWAVSLDSVAQCPKEEE